MFWDIFIPKIRLRKCTKNTGSYVEIKFMCMVFLCNVITLKLYWIKPILLSVLYWIIVITVNDISSIALTKGPHEVFKVGKYNDYIYWAFGSRWCSLNHSRPVCSIACLLTLLQSLQLHFYKPKYCLFCHYCDGLL